MALLVEAGPQSYIKKDKGVDNSDRVCYNTGIKKEVKVRFTISISEQDGVYSWRIDPKGNSMNDGEKDIYSDLIVTKAVVVSGVAESDEERQKQIADAKKRLQSFFPSADFIDL